MMNNLLFPTVGSAFPPRDELLFHPDDFAHVPEWFKAHTTLLGVVCRSFWAMPVGTIVGMGEGATLLRGFDLGKFEGDVQKAMNENAAFLALLKRNNLL